MKKYFLFILIGFGSVIYSENNTIEDCIKIEDNEKRLVCFDLVTQIPAKSKEKPAVVKTIETQSKTIVQKVKD